MLKRIQNFFKKIFSAQLDFHERLSRMVLCLAFAASLIGAGRVLLGADPNVLKALVPLCIVSAVSIWISVEHNNTRLASWILIIGTNVILFPFVFILSGGINSGTPTWFVLGFIYIFLLLDGKAFGIAMLLSSASFLASYIISYRHPEIIPSANRFYSFTDSCVTLLVVSAFIGLLLRIQTKTYDQEKKMAEEQKREVEQIAHSKDAFFANMSHEIRTPINTIIGLNEMTLREDISDEIAENSSTYKTPAKCFLLSSTIFWISPSWSPAKWRLSPPNTKSVPCSAILSI